MIFVVYIKKRKKGFTTKCLNKFMLIKVFSKIVISHAMFLKDEEIEKEDHFTHYFHLIYLLSRDLTLPHVNINL